MYNLLFVEDSSDGHNLVKRAFGNSVQLDWVKSLSEASYCLQNKIYDLILLDIMLPDGDGYRFCSALQNDDQFKNIPVVFLTAKTTVSDKVLGFSVGADDFITKPFDSLELKARVESRLRKRDREKAESDITRLGSIEINKSTQRVFIFENDKQTDVDLTSIEFKILVFLSKDLNKVYSRDEILDSVWGEGIHVYSRSVDTHISKLRKKLGFKASCIESVHGSGYRLKIDDAKICPRIDFAPTHQLLQIQL